MAIPRQTNSSRATQGTSVRVISAKTTKAARTPRIPPKGLSTRVSFTMLPQPVPIDRPQLTLWDKWRQDVMLLLFGLAVSALVFKIIAGAYNL